MRGRARPRVAFPRGRLPIFPRSLPPLLFPPPRPPPLFLSLSPRRAEYGYSIPRVTVEYDRATGYMLSVTIEYNRRLARHNQALTGAEVRNKVCENMIAAAIFEDSNFTFKEEVLTVDASELRGEEHA